MQPFPQGHGRSFRVASVLLALLVLLALVALASRTGFGHGSSTTTTPGYVNWATSIFLVAFLVMAPVSVWAYVHQARDRLERQQHKSFQARVIRSLIFIPLLAIAFFARLYLKDKIHLSSGFHHLFFGNHLAAGKGKNGKGAAPYSPTFQWPVLWAAIALFLAGVAAWVWWRKKHPPLPRVGLASLTLEEDVAFSLTDAIDDLESEPDARRAVIAAYARMEGVFSRHGLRRQVSETATEYLQRLLFGLTTRITAVERLTGLFEQAKFSDHPIDGHMKQDAIDSLRAIRDDLVAAEGVRKHWLDVAVLFVLSSGACAYVALQVPGQRPIALHVYFLFLGALLMLVVVSGVGAAAPRARRSDLAAALDGRPAPPARVSQLAKVEREVTLSIGNAYDLHTRLLPHLREIATARLERRGQRPGPDTLGRWWELLRPDRPEPAERFAPGIPEATLRELVADLEAIR